MSEANQFELNKGDNFIFGVDVSASMNTADCPGNAKRIEYLKEQVIVFATEASKWDTDGIDVLTFGEVVTAYQGVTAEKATELIKGFKANEGMTDTAAVISKAYDLHKKGGYDRTVLFLATDGAPSDSEAVKTVIRGIASDVKDEKEFKISILTVGKIAPELDAFLTELDDSLNAKFDIVDRKALQDVNFMQAFMGALND